MHADFLPRPFLPAAPAPRRRKFVLAAAVSAPRAAVFRLLADIEALPSWAPRFCECLELERGAWRALTIAGDMFCTLAADDRAGSVELCFGDEAAIPELRLPLRVVPLAGGGTLVTLTLVCDAGQAGAKFVRVRDAMLAALRGLAERFGTAPPVRWIPGAGRVDLASVIFRRNRGRPKLA